MARKGSQRTTFAILGSILLYILSCGFLRVTDLSPSRVFAQAASESNPTIYLPMVSNEEQPTPTPSPTVTPLPTSTPLPSIFTGSWVGTTSGSLPISLTVSQDSTQVTFFALEAEQSRLFCHTTFVVTSKTPTAIINSEFSGLVKSGVSKLSFSGRFNSPTTASGTFDLYKWPSDCGWTSSTGTWTANVVQ